METAGASLFDLFVPAETEQEYRELRRLAEQGGYSRFSGFLNELKEMLRRSEETELEQAEALIRKGRAVFPQTGAISPAWEHVWDEFAQIAAYKREVLKAVSKRDREGEWQVIIDNPYTSDGVICHTGLAFAEAAFLYAYFRPSLKNAEYIRLQKVWSVITHFGR